MFPRFISRMIVSASLLLIFLAWWTTNRHWLWRDRLLGIGLLVFGAALAIFLAEKGEVVLLAANSKQYEELGRFKAIDGKCWNHPVIALGSLFVRSDVEMACYRLQPATSDK